MIEVEPLGNVPSYVDLTAAIPLGATRRTILVVFASVLSSIGLVSTLLFHQLSKKDNNLRQRGRYLVTLQGLFSSIFLSLLLFYQAYKYRVPCILLYYGSYLGLTPFVMLLTGRGWRLISRVDRNHAIYLSRFAEPSDIAAALESSSAPALENHATSRNRSNPSLVNLSSLQQRRGSLDVVHTSGGESSSEQRVFELTQRSAQEIAQSKKWYNRYRTVTDRQMMGVAIIFMIISALVAVLFQLNTPGVSINPVIYVCHSGVEYMFPYAAIIIFLFVLSPIMIYQLKGIHDGFGIRKELIFISIFSAPCFVLYFVIPNVAVEFTIRYVDRTAYMVLILVNSHVLSIIMPLAHHFRTTPNNCPITSGRVFRKSTRRVPKASSPHSFSSTEPGNGKNKSEGGPQWTTTPTGTRERDLFHVSQVHLPPAPAPAISKQGVSGREHQSPITTTTVTIQENDKHDHHHHNLPSQYQQWHGRKLSASNMNMSLRNLLKNPKLSQFNIIGFSQQQQQDLAELDNQKADWEAFMRILQNQELFERLSAFTVGEFCAENTRFLYEVSRLEKRAIQYDHLREMTATPHIVAQSQQQEPTSSLHQLYKSSAPLSSRLEKTASTLTTHSILPPLPTHFSSSKEGGSSNNGDDPHLVKKIVSLSSVNSTAPLLRPRYSSSSYFDESEPSSPMSAITGGGSPFTQQQSTFMRHESGGSSTALPNLEESFALQPLDLQLHPNFSPASETSSSTTVTATTPHNLVGLTNQKVAAASAALQWTPLPMPPTLLIQYEYIYKTFIQHGGRLELNLSYDTSLEIQRRAKKGDWRSGLFDGAIDEIQELLFRDVWPKFVSSPHGLYTALQQQQQRQQSVKTSTSAFGNANHATSSASAAATQSSGTATAARASIENHAPPSHPQIGLGPASRTSIYLSFEQQPASTTPKSSLSKATSQRVSPTDPSDMARTGSTGSSSSRTQQQQQQQGSSSSIGRAATVAVVDATRRTRSHSSPKNMDGFYEEEEQTRSGFRTWLTGGGSGRRGLSGRGNYRGRGISSRGGQEESSGIIAASRKSVADRRRSDISGLYSSSIQNSMAAGPLSPARTTIE